MRRQMNATLAGVLDGPQVPAAVPAAARGRPAEERTAEARRGVRAAGARRDGGLTLAHALTLALTLNPALALSPPGAHHAQP